MPSDDPLDLDAVDQAIRINELRSRAEELAGGEMHTFEAEDAPPGIMEGFWKNVVAFEEAGWTTQFVKLEEAGVPLPDPATLPDEQVPSVLWTVIRAMADQRSYLSSTNHLSDRELYTELWEDLLREEMADMPFGNWHIDILGSGSTEDTFLRHKYYADENERQRWLKEWPNDEMPPHVDPPYDRDRHLPKPTVGR